MAKPIESQEIWEFKNPEELAQALENNSKTEIAWKIRKISSAVKDTSIDLRKKLQDELTDQEQIEIRETLKWSWVGKIFTKWMTPEEIKNNIWRDAVVAVVWAEGADMIEKWEWYIKSLSDAWETAGKLFEEWKYMAAIWVFLKWLFWGFSLKEWNKKGEKKEEGKDWEKKWEEKVDSKMQYLGGLKILYLLKWEKKNDYTTSVLLLDEIKSKNFLELKEIYKWWEKWIWEKLKISNKWSDKEIYESLKLLIDNEPFLEKSIWKANLEWKSWELWKNLIALDKIGWNLLNWVFSKLENIQFSMNPLDAANQIRSLDIFNISIPNWKDIVLWDLENRKDLIADVSTETLITLFQINDNIKWFDSKQKERLLNLWKDEKEKAFIEKIFDFRSKIINWLSWLFWEESKSNYMSFFDTHWLTMKETIELYMITNWSNDLSSLNGMEKSAVYLKLWKILWKDESFRWKFFDQKLIEWIEKWTIPEEVQMILWHFLSKVTEAFINTVSKAAKELFEAIPLKYKVIAWLLIWVTIVAMIRFKPIAIVWQVAIVAILTTAVMSSQTMNKQTGKVYTKEEIEKIVKDMNLIK